MNGHIEISDASLDDIADFTAYIKAINRLENYLDEIGEEGPEEIFAEINDAKIRIENNFIAFVNDLQPRTHYRMEAK